MTALRHNELCGSFSFEGKHIDFSLFIDYYGHESKLTITNPDNQSPVVLNLKQTVVNPFLFKGTIQKRIIAPFIYNHYPVY
jgi:hypothetical protein